MMDAAVLTFGRRGYQAASMDDIAELAGVSKPLVYLYLRSKEELFTACIRREAEALLAVVASAVEGGGAAQDRLRAGLLAFFSYTAEHPDAWAVLGRQARAQGEPFATQAERMRAEVAAYVARLVRAAAQGPCDAEGLAQALVGAAESLANWANGEGAVAPRQAAETLMTLVWTGLGALTAGMDADLSKSPAAP
ncbi:TetR/AcrR family transcriptional regulator [Streptomyces sp. NPDC053493]|uniref:TetR/AcrR family transcriptional regulator n=1 Tax=Streptomyces sp. NPDC053493 TaxID=3365705 RepID=UPI0037D59A1F